jgi:hypothetical protein
MLAQRSRSHEALRAALCLLWGICAFVLIASRGIADEVLLKNGLVLHGTAVKIPGLTSTVARQNTQGPVPSASFWMIDDGVRRYFVFRRSVTGFEKVADLGAVVSFKMKQQKTARTSGFGTIGGFSSMQPFDEFGRRTVTIPTQKGEIPVIQAITEMRPDYSRIESLTHVWEYCVDTRMLPDGMIQSLIEKSSNRDDPAERKAAVLFYVQAEMFPQAQMELNQISSRWPELKSWCDEFEIRVAEYIARRAMNELDRRREAGQHGLAYQYARQFPTEHVNAEIVRRAGEIASEYEQALRDRDNILMQLDMLQAQLPVEKAQRLATLRATMQEELHFERISRLDPFLRSESDPSLSPEDKLSLAYSGWLLGSARAIVDLEATIRLWDARFLVLEYLRLNQDPLREQEILARLNEIEGVSVERLAAMIPLLPLPFETAPPVPGTPIEIDVPADTGNIPVRYTLQLPPEYSPAHRYPLLVVLRSERNTFAGEVGWWAGDAQRPGWAQRRGYIVIAPHYCDPSTVKYNPGSVEHDAVLKSIDHVRQRYRIDSDRIFLAGHGMGGDACFDIAMSHPGLFAGAIPFTGFCDHYCRVYWDNAPHLAWYIVGGELDRNTVEANANVLNEMMKHGQNVIYCDYKDRGYETFPEEQERIFEWMNTQRRVPLRDVTKWEGGSLRKTDNQFYWMRANALPDRFYPPITWDTPHPKIPVPKSFEGYITPTGTIFITHPGDSTTIWLNPDLFDFKNRCQVRMRGKYLYNDYVKPSIEALLTDLRERGDRERLYWARLDLQ